uniref:Uncharacterized protein n=2 Tax=Grammatophora oceanica TaxID=210454 RepID=A0A7S1Y555_9STRA|mmetsp:Transcript_22211/g.33027  ORF Transcript_22211/g.33027 Transcript_22211/m.33027 type:complete len:240 (+) Transcript_22211:124-843(+)|eukprot:CAMPEP_0194032874 /NCGR_PEP_ID=MMETSP0009_2-20130614/5729_1 /TAXON_ID=210454 /ORGANISM="Grammatophora oceanica, Strain CCMP 410" /LENGTH=239 /DNA_ID=CAMNT_0038673445 /DNA_START=119 /DNA_END=838 /DNA_ORIENTATION=+
MGFLSGVQNAATKAKLQGEIALVDREMTVRKKEFGIELYDLIAAQSKKNSMNIISTPSIFKGVEQQIKEPLEKVRADMAVLEGDLAAKENEAMLLEVKREKTKPAYTAADKAKGVGTWMSNTGSEAKLQYQVTMAKREIKIRKEQFGLEIWDIIAEDLSITTVLQTETKKGGLKAVTGALGGIGKGVTSGITSGLGKLSKDEQLIKECVDKARKDVDFLDSKKRRKLREIESLGADTKV